MKVYLIRTFQQGITTWGGKLSINALFKTNIQQWLKTKSDGWKEGFLTFKCTRLDHWPMTNLDKIVEAIEPVPPVSVVLAVSEEDTQMISVNNRKQTTSLRLRGPDTSCLIIICIDWDPIWTDHCIRMYFSGFHRHFTTVPLLCLNRISCCENPLRVC